MKAGGFAVQLGEDNPFGKIPVDQAREETVNSKQYYPKQIVILAACPF